MRKLFIIILLLKYASGFANNLESPVGTTIFYNTKEHGYFRINCAPPISNTMSCEIEQLIFIRNEAFDGDCTISWTSNNARFNYNSKNSSWSSIDERNNECGIINFSSLSNAKNGRLVYKFGTHVRFQNKKTEQLGTPCKIYENIDGVEYTSKFDYVDLKCNQFTLPP